MVRFVTAYAFVIIDKVAAAVEYQASPINLDGFDMVRRVTVNDVHAFLH
ncbi:hypothetical protein HRbin36_02561 [bacterium HR36]|nr:hypothetical protein HRbin36_02561 [bacterium HR36]